MKQSSGLGSRITPISTPATANWHLARYSCAVMVMLITLRRGDAAPKGEARLSKSAHCTRAASNGALQKSRRDGRRFRAGAVVRVLGESR